MLFRSPGVTNQFIRVAVHGDLLNETNETFLVNLRNPTNATLGSSQGLCRIVDDDAPPTLTIGNATVTEGDSGATNAAFTIRLSAPSGRTVTVGYTTSDGSAVAGNDYTSLGGQAIFPPGTTNQTVRVAVLGDRLSESNETFFVNLGSAVNASVTDSQGQGTILDNDPLPVLFINDLSVTEPGAGATNDAAFTVRLSAPSGRTVTVAYATTNGTARAGLDYVADSGRLLFPPGMTSQPIVIRILGDSVLETNKTFAVNLLSPTNATLGDGRGLGTIRNATNGLVPARLVEPDFKITATLIVGTNVVIRFSTLAGQTNVVEYTDRLAGEATIWLPVPGAVNLIGTGGTVTATHWGGAGMTTRFYRIRREP